MPNMSITWFLYLVWAVIVVPFMGLWYELRGRSEGEPSVCDCVYARVGIYADDMDRQWHRTI